MNWELDSRKVSIETRSGVRHAHLWQPSDQEPLALLCVIHGLGEHGGRYQEMAHYFEQSKIGTLALDLVGHGLSPGWRGCVNSYDQLLEDIAAACGWLVQHYPSLPIILYGHSMGGNLVLNYLLRRPPLASLAIASGAWLRLAHPPSQAFFRFATLLAKALPHYRLAAPVRAEELTRDLEQQRAYNSDPLVHRRLSLRLGTALIESGEWALAHARRLPIRTLVVHGSLDSLTCPRASEEFARQSNALCSFKLFDGLLHDIHREENRTEVLNFFTDWIVQHAGASTDARGR